MRRSGATADWRVCIAGACRRDGDYLPGMPTRSCSGLRLKLHCLRNTASSRATLRLIGAAAQLVRDDAEKPQRSPMLDLEHAAHQIEHRVGGKRREQRHQDIADDMAEIEQAGQAQPEASATPNNSTAIRIPSEITMIRVRQLVLPCGHGPFLKSSCAQRPSRGRRGMQQNRALRRHAKNLFGTWLSHPSLKRAR
jgi:hypothetical protein